MNEPITPRTGLWRAEWNGYVIIFRAESVADEPSPMIRPGVPPPMAQQLACDLAKFDD